MAATSRREPLGRLSSQHENRLSLAGGAAPLKPNPPGRQRENSLSGRPSVGKPLHSQPHTASAAPPSRLSLAPTGALNRLSLGGTAQNRLSLGGNTQTRRPGAALNKSADPRPVGKKEYTAQCVKSIVNYLSSHDYDQPYTSKTLFSPTKAEFVGIMTFLMQRMDPNFAFGTNLEEEFRTYMKNLGYPFSIQKTALTPVGSPHTWPSVLAAMNWLVEYLNYAEELSRAKAQNKELDFVANPNEADDEEINIFDFDMKAFREWMGGDDSMLTKQDDDLAQQFQEKNERSSAHILKLQAKLEELKAEKLRLKNPEAEISKHEEARNRWKDDAEKLKQALASTRDYKAQQADILKAGQNEYESQHQLLLSLEKEKAELKELVAKQEFTPLQVEEMNHQKQELEENVEALEKQKKTLQEEYRIQEKTNKKTLCELEERIKVFNMLALVVELTPASARNAGGTDYLLKLNPEKKEVGNLVGLDLTKRVKPTLGGLQKHLASEITTSRDRLRDLDFKLKGLVEKREEHARKAKLLEDRTMRQEELYRREKGGCEVEIKGDQERIEGVELQVSQMRASHSRILEETETRIHQLDTELLQQRKVHTAARDEMLKQINEMMDRVLLHKDKVSRVLQETYHNVQFVKKQLDQPTVRTPDSLQLQVDQYGPTSHNQ